jgi:hypothetical protein
MSLSTTPHPESQCQYSRDDAEQFQEERDSYDEGTFLLVHRMGEDGVNSNHQDDFNENWGEEGDDVVEEEIA